MSEPMKEHLRKPLPTSIGFPGPMPLDFLEGLSEDTDFYRILTRNILSTFSCGTTTKLQGQLLLFGLGTLSNIPSQDPRL